MISISGFHRSFEGMHTRPLKKLTGTTTVLVSLLFVFVSALFFVAWFDFSIFSGMYLPESKLTTTEKPVAIEFPTKCPSGNLTQTSACPTNYYPTTHNPDRSSNVTCPSYFRWIHEDLRPWREIGITADMIQRARRTAHFRLVIVDGKAYVEKYRQSIQTRDMFTLWGILQLLRLYPGRLPDLDLMFDCDDRPVVPSRHFRGPASGPPPLFRYCSDEKSLDIVFPDWSFWGWAEVNIRPWKSLLKDIKEGNNRIKWKDRVPYAYWKGNPHVSSIRNDLMKCNSSTQTNWNSFLYVQDWIQESKEGYKKSNLEDQCTHRYKIYVEGWAWSVSEKYILACDAMTVYIRPNYYDFFVRGMVPLEHYWPINDNTKCTSLKFAVDWGNNHTQKAMEIGEAGSKFMHEGVKIEFVYDYQFHVLNEYAKLLRFKPRVPPGAVELCSEKMACNANGRWKKFMLESMVTSPSDSTPCVLPQPFDPHDLKEFMDRKGNAVRQVQMWEKEYYQQNLNNQQ